MNPNLVINVKFCESVSDNARETPYAVLSNNTVHGITNRFNVWIKMLAMHPNLGRMCNDAQSIHIGIATTWRDAIQRATEDRIFPYIVLEEIQYKAAMSLMRVTCEMDADVHQMLQEENQKWEKVLIYEASSLYKAASRSYSLTNGLQTPLARSLYLLDHQ